MTRIARAGVLSLLVLGLAACAGADMAPFGRTTVGVQEDSETIRRVRSPGPDAAPLTYEPGTVWPAPSAETPRALLPADPPPAPRGSPRSEAPLPAPAQTRLTAATPPAPPPAPRADALRPGTVLGGGVVVTGGGPIATTLSPAGSGLAIPEGAAVVLIGPDGAVRHVPVPPG
jgi:hypothetical protein